MCKYAAWGYVFLLYVCNTGVVANREQGWISWRKEAEDLTAVIRNLTADVIFSVSYREPKAAGCEMPRSMRTFNATLPQRRMKPLAASCLR